MWFGTKSSQIDIIISKKGRHCCSVGELKITFASTCNHGCKESVFNVLFNVLFLVLDFPLGAPNTLLKHVIEGSIWGIGWGGILVGLGIQFWWLGFWSCWYLSLTAVFGLTFRLLVLREYSYLGVYLSAVTIWSLPFVISFLLLMPRYALSYKKKKKKSHVILIRCLLELTWMLKIHLDTLLPIITNIINLSLDTACFPSTFKNALVTPLLKKPRCQ